MLDASPARAARPRPCASHDWDALRVLGPPVEYEDGLLLETRHCDVCQRTYSRPVEAASCNLVPGIRWAFREAGNGCHLVDVIHHVQRGDCWIPAVSLVAAEHHRSYWDFDVIEGAELDEDSAILLERELNREANAASTTYRIDESDMQRELCRLSPIAEAA